MKILICGFMGAGKSHWLKYLKKKSTNSGAEFFDLDHQIAKDIKTSHTQLGEWILAQGWPSFRKIEQEKISQFLVTKLEGVLCLGGGSLNKDLIDTIRKDLDVKMVFLDTPFDLCYERITKGSNRPLSALKKEELRKLYEERLPLYRKADLILDEGERKEIEGLGALVHTLKGSK